jgi:hypothetical protein
MSLQNKKTCFQIKKKIIFSNLRQICLLKFGSWTHDEYTIDLKNKSDSAELDNYSLNGEWDLESKKFKLHIK